jgi:hypothetical protein
VSRGREGCCRILGMGEGTIKTAIVSIFPSFWGWGWGWGWEEGAAGDGGRV